MERCAYHEGDQHFRQTEVLSISVDTDSLTPIQVRAVGEKKHSKANGNSEEVMQLAMFR